jgi:cellulose synthase/poly-beta-1,6-N-acetylglucosamine synthase-like glycosyltransferase
MIHIIITSFNEPKATLKAVNSFLKQKIKEKFKIVIVDPFPKVGEYIKANVKNPSVQFFLDPGEGKSHALNLLFQKLDKYKKPQKNDFFIFTDGDVHVSSNSLSEILKKFKDPKVGCVTGKPVSTNPRDKKYGYWSKLVYSGIDRVRLNKVKKNEFIQCSGYLFAIRKGIVKEIPLDVPEDCIIPYFVWKQSYRIEYADKAEVYVQYPMNWEDWINQRVRTIKAHENISKLYPEMPRTKSFFQEIKKGALFALTHPRNPKEFFWMAQLSLARLHIYKKSFTEKHKKAFDPAWRDDSEIQSAKPLD